MLNLFRLASMKKQAQRDCASCVAVDVKVMVTPLVSIVDVESTKMTSVAMLSAVVSRRL